jgi:ribonuclease-3
MTSLEQLKEQIDHIERALDYKFNERSFLITAFVHRSFFNENREEIREHNERLEFLGDSVLGLIVSDFLYTQLPTHPEGDLSHLRSQLVDSSACANYLQKLDLGRYVLLGRGERMNPGRGRETILSDLFEALVGAIYLDGGIEKARRFFFHHFLEDLEISLKTPVRNWKAELQDYSQKKHQRPPTYRVMKETGPDHSKTFEVAALIGDHIVGIGSGASKKEAEQAAAQDALNKMS